MAILKVTCPECGAGLKSADGFAVGESVECPKCEAGFVVPDPNARPAKAARVPADDDDDRPRRRRRDEDDEDDEDDGKSYKNSPVRFIILGILVTVMLVLGWRLYLKREAERKANEEGARPTPARLADSA